MIDTKAIRTKLMSARREEHPNTNHDHYYDGVLDALIEIEKIQNPNEYKQDKPYWDRSVIDDIW